MFILASGEEKGYFRVVSVRHIIFDCRMYCGLNRRMQGDAGTRESLAKLTQLFQSFQQGQKHVLRDEKSLKLVYGILVLLV